MTASQKKSEEKEFSTKTIFKPGIWYYSGIPLVDH